MAKKQKQKRDILFMGDYASPGQMIEQTWFKNALTSGESVWSFTQEVKAKNITSLLNNLRIAAGEYSAVITDYSNGKESKYLEFEEGHLARYLPYYFTEEYKLYRIDFHTTEKNVYKKVLKVVEEYIPTRSQWEVRSSDGSQKVIPIEGLNLQEDLFECMDISTKLSKVNVDIYKDQDEWDDIESLPEENCLLIPSVEGLDLSSNHIVEFLRDHPNLNIIYQHADKEYSEEILKLVENNHKVFLLRRKDLLEKREEEKIEDNSHNNEDELIIESPQLR